VGDGICGLGERRRKHCAWDWGQGQQGARVKKKKGRAKFIT